MSMIQKSMQVSKELDKIKCGLLSRKGENINQTFEMVPFPIMFDGLSSFSIELMSIMIQLICASFKRIGRKMWTSSRKREKITNILKRPFSYNVRWISIIFDRVNTYNDKTICASFKRIGLKMWTLSRKREKKKKKWKGLLPIMFDRFSSFSMRLTLTMIQTIFASLKKKLDKKYGLYCVNEKKTINQRFKRAIFPNVLTDFLHFQ